MVVEQSPLKLLRFMDASRKLLHLYDMNCGLHRLMIGTTHQQLDFGESNWVLTIEIVTVCGSNLCHEVNCAVHFY